MGCNLAHGFELDCRDKVGGIKNIYIGVFGDVVVTADTNNLVTAMSGSAYKYALEQNNGTFVETTIASRDNGTLYWEPVVTFNHHGLTNVINTELKALAQLRLVLFVEFNQLTAGGKNLCIAVGSDQGMMLDTSATNSGSAHGDMVGQVYTFKGTERDTYNVIPDYTTSFGDNGSGIAMTVVAV